MGKIEVMADCNGIAGLKVIKPAVFGDERGYFMETYNYNDFKEAGIDCEFVQDNQSASKKGVLRGLHFQIQYPQDKLVRVIHGEVFDVVVDLRKDSETFGKWFGDANEIQTKRIFQNFYLCGDGKTDSEEGAGLMAPRVSICAGHQANQAVQLILQG